MRVRFLLCVLTPVFTMAACATHKPIDLSEARTRIEVLEEEVQAAERKFRALHESLQGTEQDLVTQGERREQLRVHLSQSEAMRDQARREADTLEDEISNARDEARLQASTLSAVRVQYQAMAAQAETLQVEIAANEAARYAGGSRAVDELRRSYRTAGAVFDAPVAIQIGDIEEVSLVLSISESMEQLKARLFERATAAGHEIREHEIKVHDVMRANLVGSTGLVVRSVDQELDRLISSSGSQQWAWTVEAVKAGRKTLHLTLTALVQGKEGVDVIDTWREEIEVTVSVGRSASNFVKNHWQWIWSALVVPLSVAIWEGWKRRIKYLA